MPVFSLDKIEENDQNDQPIRPLVPKCPNCGTIISCGCQWVDASNGQKVCESCVSEYEKSINS